MFCVPIDRVLQPVYKGVPDTNLVYPLSLILCLPPPAARSGRHRDFDRGRSGKKRNHRVQTHSNRRRTTSSPHPPLPPLPKHIARPRSAVPPPSLAPPAWWPGHRSGAFRAPGRPSKEPHATKTYPFLPPMGWIGGGNDFARPFNLLQDAWSLPTLPPCAHPHHRFPPFLDRPQKTPQCRRQNMCTMWQV
jgi:hypothetical protein